jgi:hypothetical protein
LPAYLFSVGYVLQWLWSAALHQRRNLGRDGQRELRRYTPNPRSINARFIPSQGPFVLAMNHYERHGCNVWWPVMLVSAIVWQRRRQSPPVLWLVTDRLYRFRVGPFVIPDSLMAWFLRRLAYSYHFISVPRESVHRHVTVIRRMDRALRGGSTGVLLRPVGLTPEGAEGGGRELGQAWPSSGRVLAWLSRGEVPIIPVGVFEDETGRLTARFGAPFLLEWPGNVASRLERKRLADRVMTAIAACLPPELRGPYDGRGD